MRMKSAGWWLSLAFATIVFCFSCALFIRHRNLAFLLPVPFSGALMARRLFEVFRRKESPSQKKKPHTFEDFVRPWGEGVYAKLSTDVDGYPTAYSLIARKIQRRPYPGYEEMAVVFIDNQTGEVVEYLIEGHLILDKDMMALLEHLRHFAANYQPRLSASTTVVGTDLLLH